MPEMKDRLVALMTKKQQILDGLIAPARAAANQMKDAGMKSGADPLCAVLFEIDSVDAELKGIFEEDPRASIEAFIELISRKK